MCRIIKLLHSCKPVSVGLSLVFLGSLALCMQSAPMPLVSNDPGTRRRIAPV